MIARIFGKGASFKKVCRYVGRQQAGSEAIELDGVRGHDFELMARDFELGRSLRPEVSKPVFHGVLDFHRDERLDDGQMAEIARKYLVGIGLIDTRYAVVKHTQTSHTHLHLVASRIDYNGNPIDIFPEILRSNDVSRQLTAEYGLIPVGQKNLRNTNFGALDNSETRLYAIYRAVQESLPGCRSLEDLEERLRVAGIDVRYRIDRESGRRVGISFRYLGEAFKGKRIDKEVTLPRLEERLALQRELTVWESEKLSLRNWQLLEETRERELTLEKELKHERRRERTMEETPHIHHYVRKIRIR
jgi:hypothetical protein